MKKIAMVSYNTFTRDAENGWRGKNNKVLLLQNPGKLNWGARQGAQYRGELMEGGRAVESQIEKLWDNLIEELPNLDKFIIYVGRDGAERAIKLAHDHNIPPEKIIFVLCWCHKTSKMTLINNLGFANSRVINCECGGRDIMRKIFNDFLKTGMLPEGNNAKFTPPPIEQIKNFHN